MNLELIKPLADSLVEQLRNACVRLEIAGSIRRAKPQPNDIEIVGIPSTGVYEVRDMFSVVTATHTVNHLDDALETLMAGGEWAFDTETKRNGPRYKRLRYTPNSPATRFVFESVACDLFITDQRRWGLIYAIRTGPGDYSKALVSYARRQAMFVSDGLLHNHPPLGYTADGGSLPCPAGDACPQIIPTPEEQDVFDALGLPWLEPHQRNANLFYASMPRGT